MLTPVARSASASAIPVGPVGTFLEALGGDCLGHGQIVSLRLVKLVQDAAVVVPLPVHVVQPLQLAAQVAVQRVRHGQWLGRVWYWQFIIFLIDGAFTRDPGAVSLEAGPAPRRVFVAEHTMAWSILRFRAPE